MFFDDEGKAKHPLLISIKQYLKTANLLYWDEHYAPITDLSRLFHDISKFEHRKNICLWCFKSCTPKHLFPNTSGFAPAKTLCKSCTCFAFSTVSKLTLKSNKYVTFIALRLSTTRTLNQFSSQRSAKSIKLHIISSPKSRGGGCVMLVSNVFAVPTQTLVSIKENAISEFLNTLID